MQTRGLVPVMNNTKWDELRLPMYSLVALRPKWRTKDIETGFIPEWDGEWFHHFRSGGYECIEWVEVKVTSPAQDDAVLQALRSIHVPGEKTEHGYRVFGYGEPGKTIAYIK